jgi:hypothetical protein
MIKQIEDIDKSINDIKFTQRMISQKTAGHFKIVKENNNNIVKYSIFETVMMVLIVLGQMFYLKKLVNNNM